MKFEHKYPDSIVSDRFEFEYSNVTKTPNLKQCKWCGSYTRWIDVLFDIHVCSEECNNSLWNKYKNDHKQRGTYDNFERHFSFVKEELKLSRGVDEWKDIIIVVRNQLDYFKACIESIQKTTKNYHLYIWDNGSNQDTVDYIESLLMSYDPNKVTDWKITTMRSEVNTGFNHPNNELAALTTSPYIILLNSDTKVFENWDTTMIGYLQKNQDVAQVGYWGGHLSEDGRGFGGANGGDIDYVPGWCFCISRETYKEFRLFNDKLKFAYCEDSDLSLRLKEAGKKIYALYTPLVYHYQNKTITEVEKEGSLDLAATFEYNHAYIRDRWKHYLANDRVMLKRNELASA